MKSHTLDRKLFKAITEDVVSLGGARSSEVASAADIRRLFKAFMSDPAFHAAVRACGTPAEKHALLRGAGFVPVTDDQLKSELAKCLRSFPSNMDLPREHEEFLENILHLASASARASCD